MGVSMSGAVDFSERPLPAGEVGTGGADSVPGAVVPEKPDGTVLLAFLLFTLVLPQPL